MTQSKIIYKAKKIPKPEEPIDTKNEYTKKKTAQEKTGKEKYEYSSGEN